MQLAFADTLCLMRIEELPSLLRGDELLVYNNARVIPARLFGKRKGLHSQPPSRSTRKEHLQGQVEVFLTRRLDQNVWEGLVRPGRKLPTGEKISAARASERKILAVGTTVVRTLEDAALRAAQSGSDRLVISGSAEARLFITPGFSFRVVDALLTNFHLPRSTLLALVCAFAGRAHVLDAYKHAVEARYRFYSYGDCMLIRAGGSR